MLRLLSAKPMKAADKLADPEETRRWLANLDASNLHAASAEISKALVEALAAMDGFTGGRHDALLLVDAHAVPLHAALINAYANGGHRDRELSQRIVGSLTALTQSFFGYYDALIAALATAPAGRATRSQAYTLLTRRLAHLRDDAKLSALRYEKWIPMRWEKTHRLYRQAMQQLLHDVRAPGAGSQETAALVSSAESEYIRILLTHQLNQGQLEPRDIVCALDWLDEWIDRLVISTTAGSENAYALLPDGRTGLAPPPTTNHPALLWLDLSPLQSRMQRAIALPYVNRSGDDPAEGSGNRIALLRQLMVLWRGPTSGTRRREARTEIREAARLEFGLTAIVEALHSRSVSAEPEIEEIELRAVGDDAGPEIDTWTVYDVSLSGCRLRGSLRSGINVAPGTLVAMHLPVTKVWMVGIVRRILRLLGDEVDLGVQILANQLRVLALHEGSATISAIDGTHAVDATSQPGALAPHPAAALLLAAGASGERKTEQTVILPTRDCAPERTYLCRTGQHTYRLALVDPIERNDDYVWSTIRATRLPAR